MYEGILQLKSEPVKPQIMPVNDIATHALVLTLRARGGLLRCGVMAGPSKACRNREHGGLQYVNIPLRAYKEKCWYCD
jgi:hypothetical protein